MTTGASSRSPRARAALAPAAALAAAALTWAWPLAAQIPPAAPDDGQSAVVEALEVVAQPPGPALWKVSRPGSEVVIVGAVAPLPHLLVWDTARVERALDGANLLLVPPRPKVGLFDMAKFAVFGLGKVHQPRNQPLETVLPEPLRQQFVEARTIARQDASRYAGWKPIAAGFLLVQDFRKMAGLSDGKPVTTITKLAQAKRVRVRAAEDIKVAPLIKAAGSASDADGQACLADAVAQVRFEAANARPAAEAWARGDLAQVRAHYGPSPLEACIAQAPSASAVIEQGTEASARTIVEALNHPGKAVAVVDMTFLLRRNGVLDRLKAQGAEISVPAG